ncbi:hypothetical protein DMC30DRAFT_443848, partial [Rhodotorula diobovata]
MTRARLTAPSRLNLVPLEPGVKPRFPTFVLPAPPQPSFSPIRLRRLSGGSGTIDLEGLAVRLAVFFNDDKRIVVAWDAHDGVDVELFAVYFSYG